MPFYALLSLIDASCCIAVAFLLTIRSRRQAWILSLLLYFAGAWMALPWACYAVPDIDPIFLTRCFYGAAVVLPSLALLFGLVTLRRRVNQPSFYLTVLAGAAFGAFLFHPWLILEVQPSPMGIMPVPGYGFIAFAAYFAIVGLYTLASLVLAYQSHTAWQRNRLKWITLAFVSAAIGVSLYFASVVSGKFFGHHFFMMGSALILGYSVLRKQLYEVELATRNAASTLVAAVLAALPLLLGRVFAPIVANLPSAVRLEAVCTLLATLSFFSLAVALVRYSDWLSTRYLARVFLFASLLNAVFFMWAVPRNAFSVPVLRLTNLLIGATIMSWVEYRRAYFEEQSPRGFSLYKLWQWGSYAVLLAAAFSPWVIRSLEYYLTTHRPYAVVPGSFNEEFNLWVSFSFLGASLWMVHRFWKLFGRSHRAALWSLIGSLVCASFTLGALKSFGLGLLKQPLHIPLEFLTAACVLATFHWQPHSERHPSPSMLLTLFAATLISCLSGFLLFQGFWMQLLAGLLVAFAMPKIADQFRDSAQALVDHYLFRKKYSYLNEIQQLGEDIFRFTNLPGLLRRLAEDLAARTTLSWTGIWLYDLSEGRFLLRQSAGRLNPHRDAAALFKLSFTTSDALPQCFKIEQGLLMVEALHSVPDQELQPQSLEARALEQLKQAELAGAFPLYLGTKVIGFLGLGSKEDQSVFHQGDIQTLNQLGRKAERAIGQAYMLYEQSLMFSKLAHDTLNYLQAMGMNMDILHNEYLGPLNPRQKKQLSVAAHQRELIRESLVDLRELERLMVLRMQGTWQMVPFGLKELVDEAVEAFAPRFATQNIALVRDGGPMLQAMGEPRAIRRVVDNLLVNALKFTTTGGRVEIHLYQKGDNLFFDVKDGGPGIPESELPRLFDPFYQTSHSSSIPRGTGLGLSVVREVVSLHKGKINVTSSLGVGTTFSVEIPSVLRRKEFELPAPAASDTPTAS